MLNLTNPSKLQLAYVDAKNNYLKFKEDVKKAEKQHNEYLTYLESLLVAEFPIHDKPQILGNYSITKKVNDEYTLKNKDSLGNFKEDLQKLYTVPAYGESLFDNIVSVGSPPVNILKSPLRQIKNMPELYPPNTLNVIAHYIEIKLNTSFEIKELK